jgi:hypothetical protein
MVVLGEKPGDRLADWSADMLEIVLGALFLGSSRVRPTLLMASERLPRMWIAHRKHTCVIRGLTREAYVSCVSDFPLQGVHRFESPRLSDMSTACLWPSARS